MTVRLFHEAATRCTDAVCTCVCDFDYATVVVGLALLCMQKTTAAALQIIVAVL